MHAPPALLPLLMAPACGGLPERLGDCGDPACHQAWLERAYAREGAIGLQEVLSLPPGPDRDALIQVVVERWPGDSAPLCLALPEGAARARCQALNRRPHLWQVDAERPEASELGVGKAYPTLRVTLPHYDHPWDALDPLPVDCPPGGISTSCHEEAADRAVRDGRYQEAWRICHDVPEGKWRDECYFEASEGAYARGGHGTPTDAMELCLRAGMFFDRCLGHLAGKIGHTAPRADAVAPDLWADLKANTEAVHAALARYDAPLAERWADLVWSLAMATAYNRVEDPAGNPLDWVGPEALPHARAAMAWTLWAREGDSVRDLASWATEVNEALEHRSHAPEGPGAFDDQTVTSAWLQDLPGEEALPWVNYRGNTSRRVLSDDPTLDAMICVLEAAGRSPGRPRIALLDQGLSHADRLVRWTAARLASDLAPEALSGHDPAREPDPLVRARLLYERGG